MLRLYWDDNPGCLASYLSRLFGGCIQVVPIRCADAKLMS